MLSLLQARGSAGADLEFVLISLMIGAVVGLVFATVYLRAAAKWAINHELPFGQAALVTLATAVASGIVGGALVLIVSVGAGFTLGPYGSTPWSLQALVALGGAGLSFPLEALIIGAMIRAADSEPIGFAKGAKVNLYRVMLLLATGLAGSVVALVVSRLVGA